MLWEKTESMQVKKILLSSSCFHSSATQAQLTAVSRNKGSLPDRITTLHALMLHGPRAEATAASRRHRGGGWGVPRWRAGGNKQWNEKPTAWRRKMMRKQKGQGKHRLPTNVKNKVGKKREWLFICFPFFSDHSENTRSAWRHRSGSEP